MSQYDAIIKAGRKAEKLQLRPLKTVRKMSPKRRKKSPKRRENYENDKEVYERSISV